MADEQQQQQTTGLPPPDAYSRGLASGYSKQEMLDWANSQRDTWKKSGIADDDIAKEFNKINALQEKQPPQTPEQAATPQGIYHPENEQRALRSVEGIDDPVRRLRVQRIIKQEYANDRVMDGITQGAREQGLKKAEAEYINLMMQVRDNESLPWDQRLKAGNVLLQKMRTDSRLDYGDMKVRLEKTLEALVAPEQASGRISGANTADLMHRMRLPESDPQHISEEAADDAIHDAFERHQINEHDFTFLRKQHLDDLSPDGSLLKRERQEFFRRFENSIDPGGAGARTALGQERMYLAERNAMLMEKQLKAEHKNPHDVYNPSSKDFFGTQENISKYAVSLTEALVHQAGVGGAGQAAPVPGAAPQLQPPRPGQEITLPDGRKVRDARGLGRDDILKLGAGTKVLLPDGRIGTVPSPSVPMSR